MLRPDWPLLVRRLLCSTSRTGCKGTTAPLRLRRRQAAPLWMDRLEEEKKRMYIIMMCISPQDLMQRRHETEASRIRRSRVKRATLSDEMLPVVTGVLQTAVPRAVHAPSYSILRNIAGHFLNMWVALNGGVWMCLSTRSSRHATAPSAEEYDGKAVKSDWLTSCALEAAAIQTQFM